MKKNSLATVLRWIARIWGILSIAFILVMFIGNIFLETDPYQFQSEELLAFAFFPVGVLAGVLLGFWQEMRGGIIALGSLIIFYIVELISSGTIAKGPWFLLVAAPGLFFIAAALASREKAVV